MSCLKLSQYYGEGDGSKSSGSRVMGSAAWHLTELKALSKVYL